MSIFDLPLRTGRYAYRQLVLPRPASAERSGIDPDSPVVVAGMFQISNGIGRAARTCYAALKAQGLSPIAVDLTGMFNQVEHQPLVPIEAMPRSRSGTLLLFANAPETFRALVGLGLRRWHNWRIIGCWAWELPIVPADWPKNAKYLSEIWVPSQFVASSLGSEVGVPVKVVPHHVPVPGNVPLHLPEEASRSPFRFLSIADGRSSFHRKNVAATVRIFRNAFPENKDVELTLKCRSLDLFPEFARELHCAASEDPRLRLITHTLSDAEMSQLLRSSDVIVSTHRSEGFGLVMAEAMALGRPVMATAWSGNLQYMTEKNSRLLPFSLESVTDPTGVYENSSELSWAKVDEAAGVRAMRELRHSPEYRYTLGEMARYDVGKRLDERVYLRALAS